MFLVLNKKKVNQPFFFAQEAIDFRKVKKKNLSKWDLFVNCASSYIESRYYYRFVYNTKAIWCIIKYLWSSEPQWHTYVPLAIEGLNDLKSPSEIASYYEQCISQKKLLLTTTYLFGLLMILKVNVSYYMIFQIII